MGTAGSGRGEKRTSELKMPQNRSWFVIYVRDLKQCILDRTSEKEALLGIVFGWWVNWPRIKICACLGVRSLSLDWKIILQELTIIFKKADPTGRPERIPGLCTHRTSRYITNGPLVPTKSSHQSSQFFQRESTLIFNVIIASNGQAAGKTTFLVWQLSTNSLACIFPST